MTLDRCVHRLHTANMPIHRLRCSHTHKHTHTHTTYHNHSDGKVGPELVVAPGTRGSVTVLVDSPLVDQVRVALVRAVGVVRDVEVPLKVLLDLTVPLGI